MHNWQNGLIVVLVVTILVQGITLLSRHDVHHINGYWEGWNAHRKAAERDPFFDLIVEPRDHSNN